MSRGIFLIHNNERLVAMREEPYASEDLLQTLLEDYPDLLAGDQMDPSEPRRWLLIRREAGVPGEPGGSDRWSIDHLFLDQDSIPTLIEVKRSSDTRIRREVVGQILDYAANAVMYWPVDHLRSHFETSCNARGVNPEATLLDFLGGTGDVDSFWLRAKTNLQAGRIRLVFVADVVAPELRRIVEFLNEQMDPAEVLAVEIRQYAAEGFQTLVPSVIGQTAEAQGRKGIGRGEERQWDEPSFFEKLAENHDPDEVLVAKKLLEWSTPRVTRIYWGRGKTTASFVPIVRHENTDHQLFAVYSYGSVEFYFQYFAKKRPFSDIEKRRELLRKLNEIPGVAIPDTSIDKRPNVPLKTFTKPDAFDRLLSVLGWCIEVIKEDDQPTL
jgi:hypothetical protein